jgi:hypothetical protein
VAAVVPIDDEDYFSMRLANDPRFIEIIERSRERPPRPPWNPRWLTATPGGPSPM